MLTVHNATISNNYIRDNHNIEVTVTLPAATVNSGKALYIELLSDFATLIERDSSPTCLLINTDDLTKTNFVGSCTFISKKRLKLILNTDSANSAAS